MNHSRQNHKKIESTLIVRLSMLLVLMFGALGATQAQWASPSPGITTTTDQVGIGTASPGNALHIAKGLTGTTDLLKLQDSGANSNLVGLAFSSSSGSTAALRAKYTNPSSTTLTELQFYTNPSGGNNNLTQRMVINGTGNIGIGTTSPDYKLHITGGDSGGRVALFEKTAGQGLYILSGVPVEGGTTEANLATLTSSGNSAGPLALATGNTEVLRITTDRKVGIGTTTPANMLDVNGTISGNNIIAKYQDVAEWVPSSEQLSAGTVVVLDSTKSNQVTSSTVSYDTRVAGVVSEQPGIALGEKSDTKVLVATTGRVRVKVDASKGPIHVGDLLVTSDIPGVAMKSKPVNLGGVQLHRPGTLIGKALEPLAKGKGEILVLLSLQ